MALILKEFFHFLTDTSFYFPLSLKLVNVSDHYLSVIYINELKKVTFSELHYEDKKFEVHFYELWNALKEYRKEIGE